MNHWLCITNEENWNIVKDMNVWGVPEKYGKKLERTNLGDFLVFYIKQKKIDDQIIEPQIKGIFKITSDPFFSRERIFGGAQTDEVFPWRIRIEPIAVPKKSLEFKRLIPRLQLIKKKKKWFLYLQIAMKPISENDFELIKSAISHENDISF